MASVRILGPRDQLPATLDALQDLEILHVAQTRGAVGVRPIEATAEQEARRGTLLALVEDLEACRRLLLPHLSTPPLAAPSDVDPDTLGPFAAQLRRDLDALATRAQDLRDERVMLERFQEMVRGFEGVVPIAQANPDIRAYYLVVRGSRALAGLRRELEAIAGEQLEILTTELESGETGTAVLVPAHAAEAVDAVLQEASLAELAAPEGYAGRGLFDALPQMQQRAAAIPAELAEVEAEQDRLAAAHAAEVHRGLAGARDELAALDATLRAGQTDRAFVLDGWVPLRAVERLQSALERLDARLVVQRRPAGETGAPVKLQNPPLFRPFEAIVRMMPLPAYGSIDPTPFVAIGFPMLFGLILGDAGYGLAVGLGSAVLLARSKPGTTLRSVGQIGLACALFSVIFGLLYGEVLGDLGQEYLGLEPILLDREEAIVPALVLAVGVGLVHVALGMILGVIAARREPRRAIGRGLSLLMLGLVTALILAVTGVLPAAAFNPLLVAALVAFPLLVLVEGLLAPIELLGTFANVLSYARIMAVGTASVMLAVVANRMVGAMGSMLVGVLFGAVFHLVNFALGVFAPTVHVLRLHYVEFFGKFVEPGGHSYEPLAHWHPDDANQEIRP